MDSHWGSQKLRVGRGRSKKLMLLKKNEKKFEIKLGKRVQKRLKNTKFEYKLNQIPLTSTIVIAYF